MKNPEDCTVSKTQKRRLQRKIVCHLQVIDKGQSSINSTMSSTKFISDTFKDVKRPSANQVLKRSDHITRSDGPVPSTSKEDTNVPLNLHGKSEKDFLREFDMNLEFGPCIGITRLERWERAQKHGLEPPPEVKELLTRHQDDPQYTNCVWNDYVI